MPVGDYSFQNRIFFAKEKGIITRDEAEEWATKLKEHAAQSTEKIIALVDAVEVKRINFDAQQVFSKASFTPNVISVVVVTNTVVGGTATNIGLLGRRQQTMIFHSFDEANDYARLLLEEDLKRKHK